jgi:hypothetical protein
LGQGRTARPSTQARGEAILVSAGLKVQQFRRFCGCPREEKRKTTTTTANPSSGAGPPRRARLLFEFLESVNDQSIGDPPAPSTGTGALENRGAWRPAWPIRSPGGVYRCCRPCPRSAVGHAQAAVVELRCAVDKRTGGRRRASGTLRMNNLPSTRT